MKKLLLLTMLGLSTQVNAGFFSDNDKAYYLKHIDEAKEKVKECKKEMAIARIDKDKEKFEKLLQDKECESAYKAIREQKRAEWKAEQALRDKERKEKEQKDKIEYDKLFAKFTEEFKKMPYDEFAKLKNSIGICGFGLGKKYNPKEAKCQAYKALEKEKKQEVINEVLSKYKEQLLFDYKDKTCKNAPYGEPKCTIAREAVEQEIKMASAKLFDNKALLKKEYNACFYKLNKLDSSSNTYPDKFNSIVNSYKCKVAAEAALKLNIYSYLNPMK